MPTDRILDYTAQALQKFRPFWLEQLENNTLTLLEHFIEDANDYAQQYEQEDDEEEENRSSFTDKIAALYR